MKNQIKTRKGGCIGFMVKWFLILAVIVLALLYFFSGKVVDQSIALASKASGVEMSSNTKISFLPLEFEMRDFYIKNPDGYKAENAVSLKEVRLEIPMDPMAFLGQKPLVIEEIRIIAPHLSYEKKGLLSETNLNEIQQKITALLPSSSGKPATVSQSDEKAKGDPRKFIIKKIVFEDGKVNAALGSGSVEIPLPAFTMADLGVKENGVTAGELAAKILVGLTTQAVECVAKNAANAGIDAIKGGTDAGTKSLKNALDSIIGN